VRTLPLNDKVLAASRAKTALGLKFWPIVVHTEAAAFRMAEGTRAGTVMLGEGVLLGGLPGRRRETGAGRLRVGSQTLNHRSRDRPMATDARRKRGCG
jgi:hypothetical protein